jgi:hypothetical protein
MGPLCLATGCLCHAFIGFISLLAGPPPRNAVTSSSQRSDQLNTPVKLLGVGSHVEALQLHSNTQSLWSSGSTVCSLPGGAAVHVPGLHSHLQWNQVLLLAMSSYNAFILELGE